MQCNFPFYSYICAMRNLLIVLLGFVSFALLYEGCSTASSPCPGLPDSKGPFTISGHLLFKQAVALPANAKVICYWGSLATVPTGFDNSRVFGQGTLNMADSSFSVTFAGVPPNSSTFTQDCKKVMASGPGYTLLVADQIPGDPGMWFDTVRVLGAIDQSAMIYCISNTTLHGWFNNFLQGYGIGSDTSTPPADSLARIPNTGLTLTVDSLYSDFHFPADWATMVAFR
jgi:hypothetical protein